ncbi:unnamed protein product [Parnassius mnemosyne]|uniref:RdRp catalytic domain-containing protein n=1 Tax=Parnassius mnemosyne TaxID=213953 RepID=A0AAV1LYT2_9NEOP
MHEADRKSFHAYVTPEHLKLTHTFYQSCYRHDKKLRSLSKRTIKSTCKTREGDWYTVKEIRMYENVDTSFGNSIINYAVIIEIIHRQGRKGDAIVNGDDSIIFTDKSLDVEQAIRFRHVELDHRYEAADVQDVEFCRTKCVINNNGKPTMMMNPSRISQIFGMTYNRYVSNYQQYLVKVLAANALINKNTPCNNDWRDLHKSITFGKYFNPNTQFRHLNRALTRVVFTILFTTMSK